MTHIVISTLGMPPNLATAIITFFVYAFFGYILECIVLTIEKKHLVLNRGFAKHLPFCIIYGFGSFVGFAILSPLQNNYILLFLVGALAATTFEYMTAMIQLRFFGNFWWDYSKKPFNYKGILCLESTIGWGLIGLLVVKFLHGNLVGLVTLIPGDFALPLAALSLGGYMLDFASSAYHSMKTKQTQPLADASSSERMSEDIGM